MSKKATNIVSVFGQIEGVVADAMTQEQPSIHRIEPDMIPPTVRYDDQGRRAHCALVLTPEQERDFDRRVAALYA
jgi:hypothetical protein